MEYSEEIIHTGNINIGNLELYCMVTKTGKRLISTTSVFKAVGRTRRGESRVEGYPAFIGAKNLVPYIDETLKKNLEPIRYKAKNGKVSYAYDATIIPELADLYIEAYNDNALLPNQYETYEGSLLIVRSLAKLGITALIDEATGYESDRKGQALQKLLSGYISKDLMKWQKRFPDEFYEQIYRLYKIPYDPKNPRRPAFIGQFTNNYVYGVFPEKVIEEIKKKNPPKLNKNNKLYRENRHFQHLNNKIGLPKLDRQLNRLIAIMQVSDSIEMFKKNFKKAFEKDLAEKKLLDDYAKGNLPLDL